MTSLLSQPSLPLLQPSQTKPLLQPHLDSNRFHRPRYLPKDSRPFSKASILLPQGTLQTPSLSSLCNPSYPPSDQESLYQLSPLKSVQKTFFQNPVFFPTPEKVRPRPVVSQLFPQYAHSPSLSTKLLPQAPIEEEYFAQDYNREKDAYHRNFTKEEDATSKPPIPFSQWIEIQENSSPMRSNHKRMQTLNGYVPHKVSIKYLNENSERKEDLATTRYQSGFTSTKRGRRTHRVSGGDYNTINGSLKLEHVLSQNEAVSPSRQRNMKESLYEEKIKAISNTKQPQCLSSMRDIIYGTESSPERGITKQGEFLRSLKSMKTLPENLLSPMCGDNNQIPRAQRNQEYTPSSYLIQQRAQNMAPSYRTEIGMTSNNDYGNRNEGFSPLRGRLRPLVPFDGSLKEKILKRVKSELTNNNEEKKEELERILPLDIGNMKPDLGPNTEAKEDQNSFKIKTGIKKKKRKTTSDRNKIKVEDISAILEKGVDGGGFQGKKGLVIDVSDPLDLKNKKLADLLDALDLISPVSSNPLKSKKG